MGAFPSKSFHTFRRNMSGLLDCNRLETAVSNAMMIGREGESYSRMPDLFAFLDFNKQIIQSPIYI